jgi:very-short-patch-repair endonuclease
MGRFILFAVLLAVIVALFRALTRSNAKSATPTASPKNDFPYQKEPTLFTPAERSFLGVLEQAMGEEFRIMGKVRLADLVRVRPGLSASERQTAFNMISAKHVDFAAFAPDDLSIQFAVELDDSSHAQKARQERDTFLDGVMNAAGIPLVRFPAQKAYSIQEVRQAITSVLEHEDKSPPEDETITELEVNIPEVLSSEQNSCPKCGGDMVLRKATKGKNIGQNFWGCSNYPKCRKMMPI